MGQVEHGFGLDVQTESIAKWAEANGHEIVEWFVDAGVSGSNGVETRDALPVALKAVRDGRIEGLVFYTLDRLARRLEHQEAILGQIWANKARAYSLGDGGEILEDDEDDPMRTAIRQMRGVFSQLERAFITKRLRDGRKAKKARNGYAYGAPPFGFKAVDRNLVPMSIESDDKRERGEAETVERIRDLRNEGCTYALIARKLNEEERLPRRGTQWYGHTVKPVVDRIEKERPAE